MAAGLLAALGHGAPPLLLALLKPLPRLSQRVLPIPPASALLFLLMPLLVSSQFALRSALFVPKIAEQSFFHMHITRDISHATITSILGPRLPHHPIQELERALRAIPVLRDPRLPLPAVPPPAALPRRRHRRRETGRDCRQLCVLLLVLLLSQDAGARFNREKEKLAASATKHHFNFGLRFSTTDGLESS